MIDLKNENSWKYQKNREELKKPHGEPLEIEKKAKQSQRMEKMCVNGKKYTARLAVPCWTLSVGKAIKHYKCMRAHDMDA